MQRIGHDQLAGGLGTGAGLAPGRELLARELRQDMILPVTPDRAARPIERAQRGKADEVSQTRLPHAGIETRIGDTLGGHGLGGNVGNHAQLVGDLDVPPLRQVDGADDDTDPTAGLRDPDHLGDGLVGIAFLQHRDREDVVERLVGVRQGLGAPFLESDGFSQPFRLRHRRRLADQERIDIAGGYLRPLHSGARKVRWHLDIRKGRPTNYGGWSARYGEIWVQQINTLQEKFGAAIESIESPPNGLTDMPIVRVATSRLSEILLFLKHEPGFEYRMMTDYTAIDEMPRVPRFDLVLMLLSLPSLARIRIKAAVEVNEAVPTLIPVWVSANWAEREIFDMFGIQFSGHPDLRRILMDERWEGHPLRKDYPLRGYQIIPSAEEIHPELLE